MSAIHLKLQQTLKYITTKSVSHYCQILYLVKVQGTSLNNKYVWQIHNVDTSYWVMIPLGSTGSSHFRKTMSSNGVKVRDSGAIPPGTMC